MVPIMGPEQIALVTVIGTLVLGGGGLIGVWKLVIDRKKAPLERKQVQAATEATWVTDARVDAAAARADAAAAREEARKDREEARADRDALRAAQDEIPALRRVAEEALETARRAERRSDALTAWAHNIVDQWPTVRLNEHPPALPPEIEHSRPARMRD